ncbi:hypothetical protein HBB16_18845 [Pseudonocardia sp. MCCB 268]|nr:hypothetical protein [Pseudonocardia cytotoxica]
MYLTASPEVRASGAAGRTRRPGDRPTSPCGRRAPGPADSVAADLSAVRGGRRVGASTPTGRVDAVLDRLRALVVERGLTVSEPRTGAGGLPDGGPRWLGGNDLARWLGTRIYRPFLRALHHREANPKAGGRWSSSRTTARFRRRAAAVRHVRAAGGVPGEGRCSPAVGPGASY